MEQGSLIWADKFIIVMYNMQEFITEILLIAEKTWKKVTTFSKKK